MKIQNCLDCGQPVKGRSDKKFCDDQCRSHYNYMLHSGSHISQRPVNAILRKNHSILSHLHAGNITVTTREELLQKGFNLKFHTHSRELNGECFNFCYDYGYRQTAQEKILIMWYDSLSVI